MKDVAEACADWLARRNGQRNGKHKERHDHIWECYSIVFSTVAAAAEANVPFSFSSFSYSNFRLFLVGFSIDVDSPRSFLRWFV